MSAGVCGQSRGSADDDHTTRISFTEPHCCLGPDHAQQPTNAGTNAPRPARSPSELVAEMSDQQKYRRRRRTPTAVNSAAVVLVLSIAATIAGKGDCFSAVISHHVAAAAVAAGSSATTGRLSLKGARDIDVDFPRATAFSTGGLTQRGSAFTWRGRFLAEGRSSSSCNNNSSGGSSRSRGRSVKSAVVTSMLAAGRAGGKGGGGGNNTKRKPPSLPQVWRSVIWFEHNLIMMYIVELIGLDVSQTFRSYIKLGVNVARRLQPCKVHQITAAVDCFSPAHKVWVPEEGYPRSTSVPTTSTTI